MLFRKVRTISFFSFFRSCHVFVGIFVLFNSLLLYSNFLIFVTKGEDASNSISSMLARMKDDDNCTKLNMTSNAKLKSNDVENVSGSGGTKKKMDKGGGGKRSGGGSVVSTQTNPKKARKISMMAAIIRGDNY